MKRKIYFLISAITQIIVSIYGIFTANRLIATMMETTSMYPEAVQARINALFQNSGNLYIIIIAGINIILNVLIIYLALSNKLLKKKGSVIACSVGSLFTATYTITELLAVINIIVIAAAKRVNKEDYPDPVPEMPNIEKEEVNKKKIILAIILLLVYFSQFLWKNYIPNNDIIKMAVSICFYLTMIILAISFFSDLLRNNFGIFRKNFKAYVGNLIGKVGKFYLVYFGIAFITIFLTKSDTSVNQSNVEALPIWFSLPLAVIYAPIVEETLFRGCIRRFIKNDKLFIIISAISFGLLHTIFTEPSIYNAIVLGIPYMTIGGFLAYLYTKTNNICTNMTFHAFHNMVAMIITILIKGI